VDVPSNLHRPPDFRIDSEVESESMEKGKLVRNIRAAAQSRPSRLATITPKSLYRWLFTFILLDLKRTTEGCLYGEWADSTAHLSL